MFGLRDIVWLGCATSSGTVVQLCYDRRRHFFTEQEIAVLTMVEPAIRRLVRGCAQPRSPRCVVEVGTQSARPCLDGCVEP